MAKASDAVLDHDHRAIHNHTKVNGSQGHKAGCETRGKHNVGCKQHGKWNGHGHNHTSSQIAQQNQQNGDDQRSPHGEIFFHRAERVVDQVAAIIKRLDRHAFG